MMTTIQRRLAVIEAKAKQLYPPPPEPTPPGSEWFPWATCSELMEYGRLAERAGVDGSLSEDDERRALAIEAAARSRMLAGWPDAHTDRKRYERIDNSDWPCWRNVR
jgi:hypothetical protein